MKSLIKLLFLLCALFSFSCAPLRPIPKESYYQNKDRNSANSANSAKQSVAKNVANVTQNSVDNSKNTSSLVDSRFVGASQFPNIQNNNIQNDNAINNNNNKPYNTANELSHLRQVARENQNEYFNKRIQENISPSVPKGIFTVRNTNFITVGEKGDVWLWSTNLQNRTHIEDLGTCVDKVDLDHNTLSLFWACGAKLYTKELLNDKSQETIDRIKTRASAFSVFNNATQFLVGGADGKLYRWDNPLKINITDFSKFERYTAHATVVSAVAFHPAGRVFFSGDWQGRFKAWLSYKEDEFGGEYDENLFGGRFFEDGSTVKDSGRAGGSIEKIVVSPNGFFVILGLQDSTIEVWKLRSFKKVLDFRASDLRLLDVKFLSNDQFITLSKDNKIKVWQFKESQDELGEYVYNETLLDEKELENSNLLYVTKDGRILYTEENGNLKSAY